MAGITLRTARQVVPMIYAYTTPEIARHNGWTKIGYTEQSVDNFFARFDKILDRGAAKV